MTAMQPDFAAFHAPVDREVFAPGFRLWLRMSGTLTQLSRAAIALPDRGPAATSDDLPPEYFRFPCY